MQTMEEKLETAEEEPMVTIHPYDGSPSYQIPLSHTNGGYQPIDMDRLAEIRKQGHRWAVDTLHLLWRFLKEKGLEEEFKDWVESTMQCQAGSEMLPTG